MNFIRCMAIVGLSAVANAKAAQSDPNELVEQWLSLEIQRGKLQSAWNDRKIILDQQVQLLEAEAGALREVVETHKSSSSEAEHERAVVLEQQTALEGKQAVLAESVDIATHKLRAKAGRLPPPLQQQWSGKIKRLANAEITLSDKLDGVLQLLTLLHEFEQRAAIHSGNIAVPDTHANDQTINVLVTQVYLGASRGWYVSNDGSHYGYGESRPEGWRWWHNNGVEEVLGEPLDPGRVSALIEIIRNPDKAKLAGLPLAVEIPSNN